MEALAFTLAKEEATHGVRVNIIAPGLVITDMGNRLVKSMTGEGSEQLDEQNLFPFRRACRPEDIATAVTAVLSPSFAYMTGQRIGIDGGVADINQVLRSSQFPFERGSVHPLGEPNNFAILKIKDVDSRKCHCYATATTACEFDLRHNSLTDFQNSGRRVSMFRKLFKHIFVKVEDSLSTTFASTCRHHDCVSGKKRFERHQILGINAAEVRSDSISVFRHRCYRLRK
jgi:hypothetical protein